MRGMLLSVCAVVSIGAALIGCGGGGSSASSSKPTTVTRSSVAAGHRHILLSLAGAGVQTAVQAVGMNGYGGGVGTTGSGTSGGGTGGGTSTGFAGGGMPLIGAYVRNSIVVPTTGHPLKPSRMPMTIAVGPTDGEPGSGSTGGSTGGDVTTSGIYFDEFLGLWVENTQVSPNESKSFLYLDQAKSSPAGFFDTIYPSTWETFPIVYHSTYQITSGNFAGSHGTYDFTISSPTTGISTYDSSWAGQGTSKGSSSWSPASYTWENRFDNADGSWYHDAGTFYANGSGNSLTENSAGYKWTYHFNADGSGSGTIAGPDAGLPAAIVWDGQGHIRVTYADGTVDEWNFFDVVSSGGTTGSGSGTSGTTGGNGVPMPMTRNRR